MPRISKSLLAGTACAALFAAPVHATDFNIPTGDLGSALNAYMTQSGAVLIVSGDAVKGIKTKGVKGDLPAEAALSRLLSGTGFSAQLNSGVVAIVRDGRSSSAADLLQPMQFAQATPSARTVETVTVTSSKLGGGDVQSIPIAITALSQEQLTATQTAGGPDLIKQVPNMTFTKTNFSGYSIQIRGIGTQAISVTTDPAVAVAFNDVPFIRNHFFEQEFFDVASVEILRGPQGTLYGRNATAGVVNLTSAKPSDQFEAMASAELGNYQQRRFEAMLNLPIVDDRLAVRFAGEWTKRKGYSTNEMTGEAIDGRNLWSSRASITWKPGANIQTTLVWEHFQENDDRLRSSKQLCKRDPGPSDINGTPVASTGQIFDFGPSYLSQGCLPASPYSDESFQVPNGFSLAFYTGPLYNGLVVPGRDPYAGTTQSRDLRTIESSLDPVYKAKNDTLVFTTDYQATPTLKFIAQTGFNNDFLYATQDFNRFNTQPGFFVTGTNYTSPSSTVRAIAQMFGASGVFCDPQLGCSDRLVAQDLVTNKAWQLNQEFRVASSFEGPFNFSLGANYMHYETYEKYYVFINSLTAFSFAQGGDLPASGGGTVRPPWEAGVSDNSQCLYRYGGFKYNDPEAGGGQPNVNACTYIDPNPLTSLNDMGHNYFLSTNPYTLNSWAGFGEAYYNLTEDLKLTGGLRYTKDEKHFPLIPSWLLARGAGYPVVGAVDQSWGEFTGRVNATWTPKLSFTDQSLFYGSYAHGYKAGGANPPGAVLLVFAYGSDIANPIHPLTFKPEFIDAFELGTKNTLLDGALTFNATTFYYDYKNYQISEIIDRTSINRNFNARVLGAEVEGNWEPIPGLRFNFAGGWEDSKLAKGAKSVDLMDRTGGNSDWLVVKPFATQSSNCIIPKYVAQAILQQGISTGNFSGTNKVFACAHAYNQGLDPVSQLPFDPNGPPTTVADPTTNFIIPAGYKGFDPATAPNNGQGFYKDLAGNELPNAPKFTTSIGVQYSMPVTENWAATLRSDFYWQDAFWARVFNDDPYDRIRGYSTVNLSLILTSQSGWQAMGFIKNVFNKTAITGTFLNSDDTGLTTNVFLTDPRLIGVRITKNW